MYIETSPEWATLKDLSKKGRDQTLLELFDHDPERVNKYSVSHNGLYFDYSKTAISDAVKDALFNLAQKQNLDNAKKAMRAGDAINNTEERAVLHIALRAKDGQSYSVNDQDISKDIKDTLNKMESLCNAVHQGEWLGYSGKAIDTIVHIGIGGSDLGPYMACDALKSYSKDNIQTYFVSNVDGAAAQTVLNKVSAETTLFLIASKSFITEETLKNAQTARRWFLSKNDTQEDDIAKHFVALTVNDEAAKAFGIDSNNVFPFGDYVGGRFSLWSSIGLPIALSLGFENFQALLNGAHDMDEHFFNAPIDQNIPTLLALIGVWHRNFCDYESLAILPYAQDLQYFPAFLQQMDMESNGKEIDRHGRKLPFHTGPVVFGASGTNGQHAFYQLIHQSQTVIPCEFIAFKNSLSPYEDHHQALLSHVIAQSRALMIGRSAEDCPGQPEKYFSGNRPSTTLILDELSPYTLGQLIVLYEHKIFVQGIIWGLNSFDQPGVELGKILAKDIAAQIKHIENGSDVDDTLDPSSKALLNHFFAE